VQSVLANKALRTESWHYNNSIKVEENITPKPVQKLIKVSIPTIGFAVSWPATN